MGFHTLVGVESSFIQITYRATVKPRATVVPSRFAVSSASGITKGVAKSATPCVDGVTGRVPISGTLCIVSPDPLSLTRPLKRLPPSNSGATLLTSSLTPNLVNSERQRVVVTRDLFFQNYHVRGDHYQTRRDGEVQNHVRVFYRQPHVRDGFHGVVLGDGVSYEFVKDVLGLQTFCSLSNDGPASLCLRTQHGVDVGL